MTTQTNACRENAICNRQKKVFLPTLALGAFRRIRRITSLSTSSSVRTAWSMAATMEKLYSIWGMKTATGKKGCGNSERRSACTNMAGRRMLLWTGRPCTGDGAAMGPSTLEQGCSRTRALCRTIEPANKKGRRKQKEQLQEDARCFFFSMDPRLQHHWIQKQQAAKVLKNKFPCQGHSAATVSLAAASLVPASRPVSTLLLPAALTTATWLSTAWPRRLAAYMVATRVDDDLLKIEKKTWIKNQQKSWNKSTRLQGGPNSTLHPSASRHTASSPTLRWLQAWQKVLHLPLWNWFWKVVVPWDAADAWNPLPLLPHLNCLQATHTKKTHLGRQLFATKELARTWDFPRCLSLGEPSVERLRLRRPLAAGGGGGGATGANTGGAKGGGPVGKLFGPFGNQR